MGSNRVGFVSSYDEESGTAAIYYPDRCDEVTSPLPVLSPFGAKQKLKKGQTVLVVHLDNGSEGGVVIGTYDGDEIAGINAEDGTMELKDASGAVTIGQIKSKL